MWGLSTVDVSEHVQMVRAIGGLLSYLQNNRLQFGDFSETEVLSCVKHTHHMSL